MAPVRPTPLLGLWLLALHCAVDDRTLHGSSAAGGRIGTGGSHATGSRNGSGGSAAADGGRSAEAGIGSAAGAAGDTGSGVEQGITGAPCSADQDCQAADGGTGRCLDTWPGGYCSSPCSDFPDCAGNDATLCRSVEGEARCLFGCFSARDCRAGYTCDPELYGCVPD